MKMILAATEYDDKIYFIVNPVNQTDLDGVVVSGKEVKYVPFWSYVSRVGATGLTSNDFLRNLWSENYGSEDWVKTYFFRENDIPAEDVEKIKPFLVSVPDEQESEEVPNDLFSAKGVEIKADSPVPKRRGFSAGKRARTGARRGRLALEPYDPDARDGDGDGIVQEGTAWERPAGTRIIDALGRAIERGAEAGERPTGARVVDADGNDVPYVPTYEGGKPGTIGSGGPKLKPASKPDRTPDVKPEAPKDTAKKAVKKAPKKAAKKTPLADHGASSLKERGLPSTRETYRAATAPPAPEVPEAPKPDVPEKKPKKPKETPGALDRADLPGVTLASTARPDLIEPERPRSPYKPSPPPLSGRAQELADQADGDFKKFMELLDKEGYVVFDYETTGLADGNIPVQIGAVRIKDGKVVERFNVFTNPQRPLSDWSKENLKDKDGNPLTDEWLAEQMDLADAHRQLAEFLGDSIIVAHNLPYDGEIIERMMKDADIDYEPSGSIDTLMLLRSAVPKGDGESGPERHTLGALADFFGVDLGDAAHTADADSEAAAEVLAKAMTWAGDNDSSPDIFDAAKQKELFDEATKKYREQRKRYETDLKQYESDLADYQRAVAKGTEPEVRTDSPDYRISHQPTDVGPRAHDLTEDGGEGEWLTDDVYKNPNRYSGADETVIKETMDQLEAARGNPDATVTVYRYGPEGSEFENGNWVSLSRTYAEQHGESNPTEGGVVQAIQVPASEVRFAGDDLAEFGWFPKDGKSRKPDGPEPDGPIREPAKVPDTPDAPKEAGNTREQIETKNREIRARLTAAGAATGRTDDAFKARNDPDDRLGHYRIVTMEEATERRRETVRRTIADVRQLLQGSDDPEVGVPEDRRLAPLRSIIDGLPPETADLILNSTDEELAAIITEEAVKLHESLLRDRLSMQMPVTRLDALLETGAFKNTHEVDSNHSSSDVREKYELSRMGLPLDAPTELRPLHGWAMMQDHVDAGNELFEMERKFDIQDPNFYSRWRGEEYAGGAVETVYGDVRVTLRPGMEGRTSYTMGDSVRANPTSVIWLDETDEDLITNNMINGADMVDGREKVLRLLDLRRSGNQRDFLQEKNWSDPDGLERDPTNIIRRRLYWETQVYGGIELGDVAELHIPAEGPDIRTEDLVRRGGATPEVLEAVKEEFLSTERLKAAGLTDEEIDWLRNNWTGSGSSVGQAIREVRDHRRRKELADAFEERGVKVSFTSDYAIDLLSPESYHGGKPGQTVDGILVDRIYEGLGDRVRRDMQRQREAEERFASRPPGFNSGR